MILGKQEEILYGKGYIYDQLCGLRFKISSQSFYQINPIQTEKLYHKAIELAGLTGKETLIDAYCGIGTIGLIASQKAKSVLGVEVNRAAIQDAQHNQTINQIENAKFYLEDAEDFMVRLAKKGEQVDVVMMDPPRAGSTKDFMDAVMTLSPQRIVYISCHPLTLKRDLDYLTSHSRYQVKKIVPCDLFPMTEHIETIVLLAQDKQYISK